MNAEIVGFLAGGMVAVALPPQFIKSWKTKSTEDLSLAWMLISISGQVLWVIYGSLIASASLVVMSSITLAMALAVFYLKIRYGRKSTNKSN